MNPNKPASKPTEAFLSNITECTVKRTDLLYCTVQTLTHTVHFSRSSEDCLRQTFSSSPPCFCSPPHLKDLTEEFLISFFFFELVTFTAVEARNLSRAKHFFMLRRSRGVEKVFLLKADEWSCFRAFGNVQRYDKDFVIKRTFTAVEGKC